MPRRTLDRKDTKDQKGIHRKNEHPVHSQNLSKKWSHKKRIFKLGDPLPLVECLD
jgi:hypothetical protein